MSTTNQKYRDFLSRAQQRYSGALSAMQKSAADEEAISGIKDPNCEGTVSIPSGDGDKPSLRNMPANSVNSEREEAKQHNIHDVTKPNGVGEGAYIVPRNGDARDAAATSPTTPLDKIANTDLNQLAGALLKAAQDVQDVTEKAVQDTQDVAEKAATAEPQMPEALNDYDLLTKLASIGAFMMGTEQGRQSVQQAVAREYGIKEAAAIVQAAGEMMKQAAAAAEEPQFTQEELTKIASAQLAHEAWLNQFETELEKQAYATGAVDGDAMADAVEAGVDPAAIEASAGSMSEEDIMAILQSLVEQGIASPEDVEAILQAAAAADTDADQQYTPEEVAAMLQEAVASGQMTPEQADAIANAYMAEMGMAGAAEAAAPEETAAPVEEEVKSAAARSTQNVADLINMLYTPQK